MSNSRAVHISIPSLPGPHLIHLRDTKTLITYYTWWTMVLPSAWCCMDLFFYQQVRLLLSQMVALSPLEFVSKSFHIGKHNFKHDFLQANVSQPILDADFLKTQKAMIDFQTGHVFFPPQNHPSSFSSSSASSAFNIPVPTSSVSSPPSMSPDVAEILHQFPSVTMANSSYWQTPTHTATHSVHATGPSLSARACPPSLSYLTHCCIIYI
jgi:hypothetical protein